MRCGRASRRWSSWSAGSKAISPPGSASPAKPPSKTTPPDPGDPREDCLRRDSQLQWRVVLPLLSDRLSLRRLAPDDLHRFLEYRNDPAVSRYQGWDGYTVDQAAD